MRLQKWHLCTTALITCLAVTGGARAGTLTTINSEVDIIPNADSAETQQNSEPSLGVNPLDPTQLVAGAFTAMFSPPPTNVTTPFFSSANGGTTWSDIGSLQTLDKSIAWKTDGSTFLVAALNGVAGGHNQIQTFSGSTLTNINNFNPAQNLDQPWIRTGPSNSVYVGYNNLSNAGGKTASINVSTNGGATYTPVSIDTVGGAAGQDAPQIREAVSGSTVYAAFTRWNTVIENSASGLRLGSNIVVVKSTNSGASFSAGTTVASPVTAFTNTSTGDNTNLSVGQERVGGDLAIAVDPNNANHLVVAYQSVGATVGSPVMQLVVAESTDGGATFTTKFTTPTTSRSGEPALTILADGQIVLLYNNYAPTDGSPSIGVLSQHLVATSDDFATTTDTVLAKEVNGNPATQFDPYVGDFFDLTSVGDNFYGIFSASNADNGTLASYLNTNPSLFQRDFTGTIGTASFQLTDATGGPVGFSIDPIFFSGTSTPAPEPASLALLGTSLLGLAVLRRRTRWFEASAGRSAAGRLPCSGTAGGNGRPGVGGGAVSVAANAAAASAARSAAAGGRRIGGWDWWR
jgi:hypothetical protein